MRTCLIVLVACGTRTELDVDDAGVAGVPKPLALMPACSEGESSRVLVLDPRFDAGPNCKLYEAGVGLLGVCSPSRARAEKPLTFELLPVCENGWCAAGSSNYDPRQYTCEARVVCTKPPRIELRGERSECVTGSIACTDNCSPRPIPCTIPPLVAGTYAIVLPESPDAGVALEVVNDPTAPTSCR